MVIRASWKPPRRIAALKAVAGPHLTARLFTLELRRPQAFILSRSSAAGCGAAAAAANVGDRADLAALGAARLTYSPKPKTARALSQRRTDKPDEREKGEKAFDHGAGPQVLRRGFVSNEVGAYLQVLLLGPRASRTTTLLR
jgi:hypothetical protein